MTRAVGLSRETFAGSRHTSYVHCWDLELPRWSSLELLLDYWTFYLNKGCGIRLLSDFHMIGLPSLKTVTVQEKKMEIRIWRNSFFRAVRVISRIVAIFVFWSFLDHSTVSSVRHGFFYLFLNLLLFLLSWRRWFVQCRLHLKFLLYIFDLCCWVFSKHFAWSPMYLLNLVVSVTGIFIHTHVFCIIWPLKVVNSNMSTSRLRAMANCICLKIYKKGKY